MLILHHTYEEMRLMRFPSDFKTSYYRKPHAQTMYSCSLYEVGVQNIDLVLLHYDRQKPRARTLVD